MPAAAPAGGSSPSARSPRGDAPGRPPEDRFISERAESTQVEEAQGHTEGVHLRARGVRGRRRRGCSCSLGSSPSARSPQRQGDLGIEPRRFISERAESTATCRPSGHATPVHLRARGVHSPRWRTIHAAAGSSPSARSPQQPAVVDARQRRFISERAESTTSRTSTSWTSTVHLRARGVHTGDGSPQAGTGGSSPSARSPRRSWCMPSRSRGFISERAESTLFDLGFSGHFAASLRVGERAAGVRVV